MARGLGAASVRGLVCCDDPCEDALAKQWSLLTGRGIVQTLHGPFAGRAELAQGEAGRETERRGTERASERAIERATERGIERATERATERTTERVAAGAGLELVQGQGLGAERSGCAREYEPLHGAEQAAAERERAGETTRESGGTECAGTERAEIEQAGNGGFALVRRCEPLP